MKNRKILIVAEVFSENLGDGVIYTSLSDCITRNIPKVEVEKLDLSGQMNWISNPEYVNSYENGSRFVGFFKKSNLIKKIYYAYLWYCKNRPKCIDVWEQKIIDSDRIIIGGGQLFTDGNFGFPPKIFDIYRLCKKHSKPLSIIGCGVGKKWGIIATLFYKKVFCYASFISVRDEVSRSRVKEFIGVECFHHADPGFSIVKTRNKKLSQPNVKKLFLNLQPLNDFKYFVSELEDFSEDNYLDFWVNIVKECHVKYQISLITNGHPGDFDIICKLHRKLKSNGFNDVVIIPRAERPEELIEQIDGCDMIISTRMHAGIIAYSLGKMVIPISWDDKVNNVWSEVTGDDSMVLSSLILRENISYDLIKNKFVNSKVSQCSNIENAISNLDEHVKYCFKQ